MERKFIVRRHKIEVCRFRATFTHRVTGEEITTDFPLESTANKAVANLGLDGQGQVSTLDTSGLEWLDGLEVKDLAQATEIYEMGQAEYERRLAYERSKTPDQLRADVDFIAAMKGVDLV